MLEKKMTYIFSSDPANGAENISEDGSEFFVQLYDPISVPHAARYCTIEVQSSNIWNVVPNISVALDNNTFAFFDGTVDQVITIPNGLYDLGQLAQAINVQIDNIPATIPSDELFIFTGDQSTQRVLITFKSAGLSIDWPQSSLRKILGFRTTSPPSVGIDQTLIGEDIARFNVINSFLIHTDLIHSGIPVNAVDTAVIANVFIDVTPGSLINYTPFNIPVSNANELIGAKRSRLKFYLTDQSNVRVDTNNEYWSFTMVVRYYVRE